MNSSWKWRIIGALIGSTVSFMLLCVIYKLVYTNEDWLISSLLASISYGLGYLISKSIVDMSSSRWKLLGIDLLIALVTWIVLAFVLGVIGNVVNWSYYTARLCTFFSVSLIINNVFLRN